jgi:hypothetical protein
MWRATTPNRVRLGMYLKGLAYDYVERATVRAMADIAACDIDPLNRLGRTSGSDDLVDWIHDWTGAGFDAPESPARQVARASPAETQKPFGIGQ